MSLFNKLRKKIFAANSIYCVVLCTLIICSTATAKDSSQKNTQQNIKELLKSLRSIDTGERQAGYKLSINGSSGLGRLIAPEGQYFKVKGYIPGDPEATAKNFLAEYKTALGAGSNALGFRPLRTKTKAARSHIRFEQTCGEYPVFGAQTIVQLNDRGGVQYLLSDVMADSQIPDSLQPAITSKQAQRIAEALIKEQYPNCRLRADKPILMIYAPEVVGNAGPVRLVWKTEVQSLGKSLVVQLVLIDARSGKPALNYSMIEGALDREIFDANNVRNTDPGTLCRVEGQGPSGLADCDEVYDLIGDANDFYYNYHGRDSIDANGMTISATVRFCRVDGWYSCPWPNAAWDPSTKRIYFGDGHIADDLVAHELTHGVTREESDLIYLNESGAINESFSDMWGEWVDLTNGSGNDSPEVRWLACEDLPYGALRNMKDPPAMGDPDRMNSSYWYNGSGDNGGVHTNSGVGNKLCYLLTDGDSFNGRIVTGMGITRAAELFYEVQTNLLTAAADYNDLYFALTQAAINLGWTAGERENLEQAALAVEISAAPIAVVIDPPADSTMLVPSFDIDVTFSEKVFGVDINDIHLAGSAAVDAVLKSPVDLGPNKWRFGVSGLKKGSLNITLAPAPNDIVDLSGNDLEPAPTLWSYAIDICPFADLSGDCSMDLNDVNVFATQWLTSKNYNSAMLIGSDTAGNDFFGHSVSMDSNSAIIGAWGDDDNGNNSGSAYIFEHNGLSWSQQQKLTASDGSPENKFGYAVSINDGNTLIGAPLDNDNGISSGAAYIFNFDGSTWTQEQKLFASDGADFDNFASAVSIDGNLAIIGAYRDNAPGSDSGSAYIFSCNGATWSEQQKLTASDGASYDKFGYSVAIKDNLAIVGAYNDKVDANATGSAYIFKFDGTRWNEIQKLTASDARADDLFGQAVSIQKGYAIIGAPGNDGTAVNSGAAYIFKNDGLNWTQIQKITAPDPNTNSSFGGSVSIGTTTIIIGAPSDDDSGTNSGSAYLFKFDGKNWQYQQKLYAPVPAGYTEFGRSVAINSHTALIGAHMDNENGGNSGSAQVFELCPIADLGADCSVTFKDFASLAADWIGFFGN